MRKCCFYVPEHYYCCLFLLCMRANKYTLKYCVCLDCLDRLGPQPVCPAPINIWAQSKKDTGLLRNTCPTDGCKAWGHMQWDTYCAQSKWKTRAIPQFLWVYHGHSHSGPWMVLAKKDFDASLRSREKKNQEIDQMVTFVPLFLFILQH